MPHRLRYVCGCEFSGDDFPDAPEHCPVHGEPTRIFGHPVQEVSEIRITEIDDKQDMERELELIRDRLTEHLGHSCGFLHHAIAGLCMENDDLRKDLHQYHKDEEWVKTHNAEISVHGDEFMVNAGTSGYFGPTIHAAIAAAKGEG